jgi:hypothetical protein
VSEHHLIACYVNREAHNHGVTSKLSKIESPLKFGTIYLRIDEHVLEQQKILIT